MEIVRDVLGTLAIIAVTGIVMYLIDRNVK